MKHLLATVHRSARALLGLTILLAGLQACEPDPVASGHDPRPLPTSLAHTQSPMAPIYEVSPGVSDTRQGLSDRLARLARALANALGDNDALRRELALRIARSSYPEHQLDFSALVGDSEALLLESLADAAATSRNRVLASLDSLVPLELTMPFAQHRNAWDGGKNLLVASFFNDDQGPLYGFDLSGNPVTLTMGVTPTAPTLFLLPAETNFDPPDPYLPSPLPLLTSSPIELKGSYLPDLHEWPTAPEIYIHTIKIDTVAGTTTWFRCSGDAMDIDWVYYYFNQDDNSWSGTASLAMPDASYVLWFTVWEDDDLNRCDGYSNLAPTSDTYSWVSSPVKPVTMNRRSLPYPPDSLPFLPPSQCRFGPSDSIGFRPPIPQKDYILCHDENWYDPTWPEISGVSLNDDFIGVFSIDSQDCFPSADGPQRFYLTDESGNTTSAYVDVDVAGVLWDVCPPEVAILGPNTVQPETECEWVADTEYGDAPFSFSWVLDEDTISSSANVWVEVADSDFSLTVFATDSWGKEVYETIGVTVDEGANPCPPPSPPAVPTPESY